MHILLAFFMLIFMLNSLIKSLTKKIHFFRIDISTSILQTYFGCVLSITNDFRTIFCIYTWICDNFQKSLKISFCSIFPYQLRNYQLFFPDRKLWSNHYWNFVEWTQEMLSHTYHHPISCLDPIFEFVLKFSQISFFMHISLRATLKRSLRSCFQPRRQNFFIEF